MSNHSRTRQCAGLTVCEVKRKTETFVTVLMWDLWVETLRLLLLNQSLADLFLYIDKKIFERTSQKWLHYEFPLRFCFSNKDFVFCQLNILAPYLISGILSVLGVLTRSFIKAAAAPWAQMYPS